MRRSGQLWRTLDRSVYFLTCLDRSGPIQTGLNIFVQVRRGLDTSGQGCKVPDTSGNVLIFWTGLNMSGKFWTIQIPNTRIYGPLRGPTSSSCGGLQSSADVFFVPSCKKRAFFSVLAHFRPFLVSSCNLGNFH